MWLPCCHRVYFFELSQHGNNCYLCFPLFFFINFPSLLNWRLLYWCRMCHSVCCDLSFYYLYWNIIWIVLLYCNVIVEFYHILLFKLVCSFSFYSWYVYAVVCVRFLFKFLLDMESYSFESRLSSVNISVIMSILLMGFINYCNSN